MALTPEQAQKVHDLFEARKYAKTPEEKAAIQHAIDQAARNQPSSSFAQPIKNSSGEVVGVKTAPGEIRGISALGWIREKQRKQITTIRKRDRPLTKVDLSPNEAFVIKPINIKKLMKKWGL